MHISIAITLIFALCGMLMAARSKTSTSQNKDQPILYDIKVFEHGGFCYFAKAGDKNAYIVFLISSSQFPYEKYEYRVPNGNSANPWNNEASVRLNDQTNRWVEAFCKKANLKFPPPRNAIAKPVITDIPKVPDVPKDYSSDDREPEELTDKYVNAIKTAIEKLNVELFEEALMKPQEFSRATFKDIAKDGKGVMTRAEFMEEMRPLAADHDQIEVEFLQGPFDSKGKDTKRYFKMVAAYVAARTFIPKNFTPHEFSISNRAEHMRDAFGNIDHVWTENSEGDLYQNLSELRKEIKEKLSKKRNEIKTTKKTWHVKAVHDPLKATKDQNEKELLRAAYYGTLTNSELVRLLTLGDNKVDVNVARRAEEFLDASAFSDLPTDAAKKERELTYTPMHAAVRNGNRDVINLLASHTVSRYQLDKTTKNSNGQTALKFAEQLMKEGKLTAEGGHIPQRLKMLGYL